MMKYLEIIEPEKQINVFDIENAEKEMGIILPENYKEFLFKINGGHPHKNCFPMLESDDERFDYTNGVIGWFSAIHDGYNYNLIKSYRSMKTDRIPEDLLIIADDPFGNAICLGILGERHGKVYFWDHEGEAAAFGYDEAWYDNIYLVANSFEDFINSLYKFDLESAEDGSDIEISIHDEYSLRFCNEGKRYGNKLFDFFEKSPQDMQDFVIKEYTKEEIIELSFKDEKAGKQYFRELKKASGEIIREYEKS